MSARALTMRQVALEEASAAAGVAVRRLRAPNTTDPTAYVMSLGGRPVVLSVYGLAPRRTVWLSASAAALCSDEALATAQRTTRQDGTVVSWVASRSALGGARGEAAGVTLWWTQDDTHFALQSSELSVNELIVLSAQVR